MQLIAFSERPRRMLEDLDFVAVLFDTQSISPLKVCPRFKNNKNSWNLLSHFSHPSPTPYEGGGQSVIDL